jgi:transcriptional regulator with XRE-family HTH domain
MADGGKSLVDIGRRVLMLREALGLNQSAFSRLVDISQPSLANYEKGFRRPELDKAIQIVNKTGVTLDWIYLGDRSGLPQRLLAQLEEFDSRSRMAG